MCMGELPDIESIYPMKIAMVQVVTMAVQNNRLTYLYENRRGEFTASYKYWDDWLFKAYPGGKKILSVKGKKRLEEK